MLKRTVSADGRVMPADRRTVLRSMLTVGAIGAKPIAVGAAIAAEPAGARSGLDADAAREVGGRRNAAVPAVSPDDCNGSRAGRRHGCARAQFQPSDRAARLGRVREGRFRTSLNFPSRSRTSFPRRIVAVR